ncbi:POK9 protein, partial [Hypocryptadius cinnamomeus]|nr:POK9 protein [Hypocryptadius cinnamomeus]
QLRQTVSQFGFKSEPVKQMLDYLFDTQLLLPNDLRSIAKLIATSCLQPATAGSLGLDLAAAVKVTLMTTRPEKISTGVYGPIQIKGQGYGGLLLGRSSVSIIGLFVLPSVIDADYKREIQIMAYTPFPPLTIEAGQRIAQFIPLPQLSSGVQPLKHNPRGAQGFGSSGLAMLTMDLHSRPKKKIKISYAGQTVELWGLLDTGADTSIVAPEKWPPGWPVRATTDTVTGVGGFTLAQKT